MRAKQRKSEGTGRFRPRARLLSTIGSELISSEVVAVLELVRNAYDADATRVEIRFRKVHAPAEAFLEIEDNGHGMNKAILLGPWMEPATDHKTAGSSSGFGGVLSPRGRRRLGSKGVGRFAAQRLGEDLQLISRHAGAREELAASFDWATLLSAGRYLDELVIPWQERSPERIARRHGTVLVIRHLRDRWSEEGFERLRIALARLVSPGGGRDRFSIRLSIDGHSERLRSATEQITAMYSIRGEVDRGVAKMVYSDLLGASETWERPVTWPEGTETSGPFSFRISAWDLDRPALERYLKETESPLGLREFRRLLRDNAGISLYRDGFRILPYGEPDNDWLRLDRRRVNNPTMRLSNNQVLGAIQLQADRNSLLRDQTNREGLIVNDALRHLQHVVIDLLTYLETRRFSARRKFVTSSASRIAGVSRALAAADSDVRALLGDETGSQTDRQLSKRLRAVFAERARSVAEVSRRYTSLATAGKLAGLVFDQLRHPLRRLDSEVRLLADDLADAETSGDLTLLKQRLTRARSIVDELQERYERLDPLAIAQRDGQPASVQLPRLLEEVLEAFRDTLNAGQIHVERDYRSETPIETRPAVIQQVFAILLDNALYWLGQQRRGPRLLRITATVDGFAVWNNGPRIPKEHVSDVFEPGFTLRRDAAGFGLALARDLLLHTTGEIAASNAEGGVAFQVRLGPLT